MDSRIALPAGYQLSFPGMLCTVEGETGRGSNAIVYRGWYPDALDSSLRHNVLIKELFPYHEKGAISRGNGGEVVCHADGRQTLELHTQSFQWGNEIHLRLRQAHPEDTGGNLNTFALNHTYYTILDFAGGRTLDAELAAAKEKPTLRRIVQRCIGVLESLELFHEMGYLHLDISPDNVILLNRGRRERVELIDYNSVVPLRRLDPSEALRFSMKPGFTAPEVRKHDARSIGPWTDLYSATALFYYCLMGTPLTRMQLCGLAPVQVSQSPYLQDIPETAKSQIQKILLKGLATTVKKRCQTAGEMLTELRELMDRIDGVGVTHWALWEAGAKSIQREIKANPGLDYLTHEDTLYPMEIRNPGNGGMNAFLQGTEHAVLTGSGGAGKTTALLRTAWLESRRYRADQPAVLYVPLYDYIAGNGSFIHDKILQKMRFHTDTQTYAGARHALDQLLQKPLQTKRGQRPVLCLMLDGYNEITADPDGLQKEIRELAAMDGVSILITSRYPLPEYGFAQWTLEPLSVETVAGVMGSQGLLLPEDSQVVELLRNAMMLSLFVSACLNEGEQLSITTRQELILAYLKALLAKELRSLPSGSPEFWQLEAAVKCVLPVAAETERQQSASGELLVKHVTLVYQQLGRRSIRKRFTKWAGHTADIRGEAREPEAWYRLMIQEILWRRLGLLVQDANGGYRIFHQDIQEVLADQGREILTAIQRRRLARTVIIGALGAALLTGLCWGLLDAKPEPYDPREAIDMLGYTQMLTTSLDRQLMLMEHLLSNENPEKDSFQSDTYVTYYGFDKTRQQLRSADLLVMMDRDGDGDLHPEYRAELAALAETGKQLPWSSLSFDEESLMDAVTLFHTHAERYLEYVDTLEAAYTSGREDYSHCRSLIRDVLEADTQVCAAYYTLIYETRLEGLAAWEGTPGGSDYAGTYKRLSDSRQMQETLMDWCRQWSGADLNEMAGHLAQALDRSYEARSRLARDAVYVRCRKLAEKE